MASTLNRKFVKVALPSADAGIGDALRIAFRMDGEGRSIARFEELLHRLD